MIKSFTEFMIEESQKRLKDSKGKDIVPGYYISFKQKYLTNKHHEMLRKVSWNAKQGNKINDRREGEVEVSTFTEDGWVDHVDGQKKIVYVQTQDDYQNGFPPSAVRPEQIEMTNEKKSMKKKRLTSAEKRRAMYVQYD